MIVGRHCHDAKGNVFNAYVVLVCLYFVPSWLIVFDYDLHYLHMTGMLIHSLIIYMIFYMFCSSLCLVEGLFGFK